MSAEFGIDLNETGSTMRECFDHHMEHFVSIPHITSMVKTLLMVNQETRAELLLDFCRSSQYLQLKDCLHAIKLMQDDLPVNVVLEKFLVENK